LGRFVIGFLRDVGKFAGQALGFVVGGAVGVVGELTGSEFIKEVGDGVKKASENTGDVVGQVVDGAWNTASGIIQDDKSKIDNGLNDMGDSIGRTAKGVFNGAKSTFNNGKDIYEGFRYDDDKKIKSGVRNIAKTVAVGALSIGVIDLVDGFDGADMGDVRDHADTADVHAHQIDPQIDHSQVAASVDVSDNMDPGEHFVHPNYVKGHWQNGNWIDGYWRDGDGDTSVDLTVDQGGGYMQSNPDGDPSNNLG
jgi:hypothetical protein